MEPAVEADCDIPETCTHAGYLLFKQNLGNELNLNNKAAVPAGMVKSLDLSLNPAAIRLLSSGDKAELQLMLDRLKPYISGPRVRWDQVPATERGEHNQTLKRIFGDAAIEPIVADYATRLDAFNRFADDLLTSQNAFVILDAKSAKSLLDIATAAAKGTFAAVRMLEPGARVINGGFKSEAQHPVQ